MLHEGIRLLVVLTGCTIALSCGPRVVDGKGEQLRDHTERFVRAAVAQDTVAIQQLAVSDPSLLNRLKHWWSNEPGLLAAAQGKLKPRAVADKGADTLYGELEFPYKGRSEALAVGFVRTGSTWRLYFIGLPDRL